MEGGKCEKAGHLWEEWQRVRHECQIDDLGTPQVATTQTRNAFPRTSGYSPTQWVLGVPELRLPGSLPDIVRRTSNLKRRKRPRILSPLCAALSRSVKQLGLHRSGWTPTLASEEPFCISPHRQEDLSQLVPTSTSTRSNLAQPYLVNGRLHGMGRLGSSAQSSATHVALRFLKIPRKVNLIATGCDMDRLLYLPLESSFTLLQIQKMNFLPRTPCHNMQSNLVLTVAPATMWTSEFLTSLALPTWRGVVRRSTSTFGRPTLMAA